MLLLRTGENGDCVEVGLQSEDGAYWNVPYMLVGDDGVPLVFDKLPPNQRRRFHISQFQRATHNDELVAAAFHAYDRKECEIPHNLRRPSGYMGSRHLFLPGFAVNVDDLPFGRAVLNLIRRFHIQRNQDDEVLAVRDTG